MPKNRDMFQPLTVTLGKSHQVTITSRKQYNNIDKKRRIVEAYEVYQNCNLVAEALGYKDSRCIRRALKSVNYPLIPMQNKINVKDRVLIGVIERIDKGEKLVHIAKEMGINHSTLKAKILRYKKSLKEEKITKDEALEQMKHDLLSMSFLGERPIKQVIQSNNVVNCHTTGDHFSGSP